MARDISDYRLETLSGEPLTSNTKLNINATNNINKNNIVKELNSEINNLERKISNNEYNNIDIIKILIFILTIIILLAIIIWILKLIGKLPKEIEELFNNLVNYFKSFFVKKSNKQEDDDSGPLVSLTAPPTPFKTIKNSEVNDGKDVPDETQVNDNSLPEPSAQPRVVSNAQTWIEGSDPREVSRSQISVPPIALPQEGNPDPIDTLDNSDSKKSAGYCFIGEDRGFRSCIYVNDYNKCLSGQIYPNEALCINPNFR